MENTRKLQLKKIFNYCINNNLFFNYSPHVESINIYNEERSIGVSAYYDGELYGYEDEIMPFVHVNTVIDHLNKQKKQCINGTN